MENLENENLFNELVDEFGERVIALAQHLGLNLEIDEDEFQLDENETFEDDEEKQERLAELAEDKANAIETIKDDLNMIVNEYDNCFSYGRNEEYLVLTDDEADDAEDDELDRYIDECLDIPAHIRPYFDEESWKRDARFDGRGHILSTYDGCEYEETVDGTTYYIYRV